LNKLTPFFVMSMINAQEELAAARAAVSAAEDARIAAEVSSYIACTYIIYNKSFDFSGNSTFLRASRFGSVQRRVSYVASPSMLAFKRKSILFIMLLLVRYKQ